MREVIVPLEIGRPVGFQDDLVLACGKPLLHDAALTKAEDRGDHAVDTGRHLVVILAIPVAALALALIDAESRMKGGFDGGNRA